MTMGRKHAKAGQVLQQIIEASRDEFSLIGPAATKIDSIAARANITRQAIYYYYKSKDDIFCDLVLRELNVAIAHLEKLNEESSRPDLLIEQLLRGLLENVDSLPTLTAFMVDFARPMMSDQRVARVLQNAIQPVVRKLQALLDEGARQGALRGDVDAAHFFAAACLIMAGARNSRNALALVAGIDTNSREGMASWRSFAVNLLMHSIRVAS